MLLENTQFNEIEFDEFASCDEEPSSKINTPHKFPTILLKHRSENIIQLSTKSILSLTTQYSSQHSNNHKDYVLETPSQSQHLSAAKQVQVNLFQKFFQNSNSQFKIIYLEYQMKKIQIQINLSEIESLTCGWLLSEAIRQLSQVQSFNLDNDKVVALVSKDHNYTLDYYLSELDRSIKEIKDEQILMPYIYNDNENIKQQTQDTQLTDFTILKQLGEGGFSKVFLVRKKDTGKLYALKVINRLRMIERNKLRLIQNEKFIMEQIKNQFLIQLFYTFTDENYIFFVLEFCPGGELFYHLTNTQQFTEKQAQFYFAEVLSGINYLHNNNFLYRDLKPENILVDLDGHIKITDFGLSRILYKGKKSYSFCGSPEYIAPEMLAKQGYERNLDYYCIGVFLYELVTGLPPFYHQNKETMFEYILKKKVSYPSYLSSNLKILLQKLLERDPKKRIGTQNGIDDILKQAWCQNINKNYLDKKKYKPPIHININKYYFHKFEFNFEIESIEQIEKHIAQYNKIKQIKQLNQQQ